MRHDLPGRDAVPDYAPYESMEALDQDLALAASGFLPMKTDRRPKPGADKEPEPGSSEARRALARLLGAFSGLMVYDGGYLSGPPCGRATFSKAMWLATAVAALIDPDDKTRQYELVLRRRKKGPMPLSESEAHRVVHYIRGLIGSSDQAPRGLMKNAIADAMNKFNISREKVYSIWRRREPRLKPPVPTLSTAEFNAVMERIANGEADYPQRLKPAASDASGVVRPK
jgi:hypothetical protein